MFLQTRGGGHRGLPRGKSRRVLFGFKMMNKFKMVTAELEPNHEILLGGGPGGLPRSHTREANRLTLPLVSWGHWTEGDPPG